MVGSTTFLVKNETLHLIAGFNNIQHILTNQSVPSHTHWLGKREFYAQLQEGAENCLHTEVGSSWPYPPFCMQLSTWMTNTSLSLFLVPLPHMPELYTLFFCARRVQNIACQGLCYFEVCIPQASVRYGSCLLDSYFLDRSFQMHFAGKPDGFDKNWSTMYKEKIEKKG